MKKSYMILSGGGDLRDSFRIDEKFFSLLKNNSKILYIPIALKRDKIGYEACYDWFSTIVSSHSVEKDIDYTMFLEEDSVPDLDMFDAIYIGGGNTYKLLNFVIKSGFGEKIKVFLEKGGIVYGGSAGAMILGKDIRTVEEENDNNYKYFEGLNLLNGLSISCHYTKDAYKKIFNIAKKIKSTVVALPEDAGVIFDNKGKVIEIVGDIVIFNKHHKLNS